MSLLDDAIGLFSPGWKASRLRARAVIKAYEAVKPTRTHKAQREIVLPTSSARWGRFRFVSRPVGWITITIW
jgi:capsid protein